MELQQTHGDRSAAPSSKGGFVATCALLLGINTAAHFLPPERASVAADDLSNLLRFGGYSFADIFRLLSIERQRPIQIVAEALQARLVGDSAAGALLLPYVSSALLLCCAYALLRLLLEDRSAALLGAIAFCLVPQTVEIHHTAMYLNINVVLSLWLLCAASFLSYLRGGRRFGLAVAFAVYSFAVFWYEVGFFVPLVFLFWGWQLRSRRAWHAAVFVPVAVLYFLYGYTSVFGTSTGAYTHVPGWSLTPAVRLVWFGLGPYLLRNLGYGAFGFTQIPPGWLAVVVLIDAALLAAFWKWFRGRSLQVGSRSALMGLALALGFLLPLLSRSDGGVAGRHLVVPAVGLITAGLWLVTLRGSSRRAVTVLLGAALVVAQGSAWVQVVSCRINRAVADAMRSRAEALRTSTQVVIDLESFVKRIPSTWVPVDFDLLNTYYGAETFQDWGLISMVRLASGNPETPVRLAVTSPILAKGEWRFVEGYATGGRGFQSHAITIPTQGAMVIGFTETFGASFEAGLGRPGISGKGTPDPAARTE